MAQVIWLTRKMKQTLCKKIDHLIFLYIPNLTLFQIYKDHFSNLWGIFKTEKEYIFFRETVNYVCFQDSN